MMKRMKVLLSCLCLFCFFLGSWQPAEGAVAVFCYHEVDRANDGFAVSHQQLEEQIRYMKKQGYRFVSLDEYLRYTKGELALPEKSVMITFDDGYRSFYTKVYPLLEKYQVPGMLAIVSSWTNQEEKPNDVRDTASWEELQEMEKSGLVTVVSHTHAMHKQQAINPQGGRNGVVGSHLYVNGHYETDAEYKARVKNDIDEVQRLFQEKLGHKSRVMVWPYGIYTKEAVDIALAAGMEGTFLLDGGMNGVGTDARLYARRMIMERDVTVQKLKKLLTVDHDAWDSKNLRMAQVDLDNIYSKNPARYERNIKGLITVLQNNDINLVALQAFADPDGDGNVDKVYFSNGEVPVAADIFNDVATRLQQQGITVVAWLPVLNYQNMIKADDGNAVRSTGEKGWYHRLSPFATDDLTKVNKLFYELAVNTQAAGVLLQDDLYLNQDEDVSIPAQQAYKKTFGRDLLVDVRDTSRKEKITKWKIEALDKAAQDAVTAFKQVHPHAVIMRDIYAGALLYPDAETWLGQSYEDYLSHYDYTVVMAYPFMDREEKPYEYLRKVAKAVKDKGGMSKSIIKIQTYDWENESWLGEDVFNRQLRTLKQAGIKNLGYYPVGFYHWSN